MRGADTRVSVCFCLGSRYTPDTQPDTQVQSIQDRDKLVYCHEAMHVQLRMQDAGWSADVERHESDEDSDGSATERDADERAAGNLSESAILRLMV